jgi:hypothetical protein
MKLRNIIIPLIAFNATIALAEPPQGLNLTCEHEYVAYKGTRATVKDYYYMWVTNTTGKPQKLHVKMTMTIPYYKTEIKEYDVSVPQGLYVMPKDYNIMSYRTRIELLLKNEMTMEVTGFVNMKDTKTCYIRFK